jgi:CheY-like chemotaxis protein
MACLRRCQMTILLIEDSRFLRLAIERLLAKAGYRVLVAGDGQAGLQAAQSSLPDLILLDLMLPLMVGTSVLRALKNDPATAEIPVVVLTGLAQLNEAKLLGAGALGYIEKTSLLLEENPERLIEAIERALTRPRRTLDRDAIRSNA